MVDIALISVKASEKKTENRLQIAARSSARESQLELGYLTFVEGTHEGLEVPNVIRERFDTEKLPVR